MVNTSLTRAEEILEHQQALLGRQTKRLARRIHDDVSQKMTLLSLQLSLAGADEAAPADWAKSCQAWSDMVMELGQTIREITGELRASIVDESGLKAALHRLARTLSTSVDCSFVETKGNVSVPTFVANELFSICQEIATDVLLPAKVSGMEIELEQKDGGICLYLRAKNPVSGPAVISEKALQAIEVEDRMRCIEGSSQWQQSTENGIVVSLSLPLDRAGMAAAD
jgi:signal transduction histidine kinase